MRTKLFRGRNIEGRMSAATITAETQSMIQQMALPLVPQRRVKGALGHISRETGVSYSKLRKIYYRVTDHILAFEFTAIAAAHSKWLLDQERKLESDLQAIRYLRESRKQGSLPFGNQENDTRPAHEGLGAPDPVD